MKEESVAAAEMRSHAQPVSLVRSTWATFQPDRLPSRPHLSLHSLLSRSYAPESREKIMSKKITALERIQSDPSQLSSTLPTTLVILS